MYIRARAWPLEPIFYLLLPVWALSNADGAFVGCSYIPRMAVSLELGDREGSNS